jgi:hypothetical protein
MDAAQLPENAMRPAFGNLNKGMAALAEGTEKGGRACGKCQKRPWNVFRDDTPRAVYDRADDKSQQRCALLDVYNLKTSPIAPK